MLKMLCKLGIHNYTDKMIPFDSEWWDKNTIEGYGKVDRFTFILYEECIRCKKIRKYVKCNIDFVE